MLHSMALEGGKSPLHIACLAGHLSVAATVIKLRQEFCWELNQDGFSPLHIAAACGYVDIVKELLKVDLGLCLIKGKDRRIPLHLAVIKGKVEVVNELLLSSVDSIECATAQRETPLHLAMKNSQFEAFEVLIHHLKQFNKEHLLNSKDIHGNTILHLAVSRKQYEVIDFLLNKQVTCMEKMELNVLNNTGLAPLDMLLMFQSEAGDREIEEILSQARAIEAGNLPSPDEERPNRPHTRRKNGRSPAGNLLDYFKYNNLKDSPNMVRNTLLVIVILITSATYQPILNPPGGVWQDDYTPSAGNNTAMENTTTSTKPRTAGKAIMATHNPIGYSIFLSANSLGFYISLYMIDVLTAAFPLRLELQLSTFALSVTYGVCMASIAPNNFIMFSFIGASFSLPFLIPYASMLFRNYLEGPRNLAPSRSQERV